MQRKVTDLESLYRHAYELLDVLDSLEAKISEYTKEPDLAIFDLHAGSTTTRVDPLTAAVEKEQKELIAEATQKDYDKFFKATIENRKKLLFSPELTLAQLDDEKDDFANIHNIIGSSPRAYQALKSQLEELEKLKNDYLAGEAKAKNEILNKLTNARIDVSQIKKSFPNEPDQIAIFVAILRLKAYQQAIDIYHTDLTVALKPTHTEMLKIVEKHAKNISSDPKIMEKIFKLLHLFNLYQKICMLILELPVASKLKYNDDKINYPAFRERYMKHKDQTGLYDKFLVLKTIASNAVDLLQKVQCNFLRAKLQAFYANHFDLNFNPLIFTPQLIETINITLVSGSRTKLNACLRKIGVQLTRADYKEIILEYINKMEDKPAVRAALEQAIFKNGRKVVNKALARVILDPEQTFIAAMNRDTGFISVFAKLKEQGIAIDRSLYEKFAQQKFPGLADIQSKAVYDYLVDLSYARYKTGQEPLLIMFDTLTPERVKAINQSTTQERDSVTHPIDLKKLGSVLESITGEKVNFTSAKPHYGHLLPMHTKAAKSPLALNGDRIAKQAKYRFQLKKIGITLLPQEELTKRHLVSSSIGAKIHALQEYIAHGKLGIDLRDRLQTFFSDVGLTVDEIRTSAAAEKIREQTAEKTANELSTGPVSR